MTVPSPPELFDVTKLLANFSNLFADSLGSFFDLTTSILCHTLDLVSSIVEPVFDIIPNALVGILL